MHDPISPDQKTGSSARVTDPGHLLPDHSAVPERTGHTRLILIVVLLVLVAAFIGYRIHTSNVAAQQEAAKTAAAANRAIPVQVSP